MDPTLQGHVLDNAGDELVGQGAGRDLLHRDAAAAPGDAVRGQRDVEAVGGGVHEDDGVAEGQVAAVPAHKEELVVGGGLEIGNVHPEGKGVLLAIVRNGQLGAGDRERGLLARQTSRVLDEHDALEILAHECPHDVGNDADNEEESQDDTHNDCHLAGRARVKAEIEAGGLSIRRHFWDWSV